MTKRQEVTDWFLSMLHELQPNNKNIQLYKEHLSSLSDEAFTELMTKLANEEMVLPFYSANLVDKDVEIANGLKVGKKLNIEFFQRLWMTDHVSGVKYLTPHKYFVVHLPIRRQAQHVSKGKSVVESSAYIDSFTGQPAGASRTSRLSLPEIMNLDSLKLHHSIDEMINVRGGNELGFRVSRRGLVTTGEYTLKEVHDLGTRATSNETLKSFLFGMHYENNV